MKKILSRGEKTDVNAVRALLQQVYSATDKAIKDKKNFQGVYFAIDEVGRELAAAAREGLTDQTAQLRGILNAARTMYLYLMTA